MHCCVLSDTLDTVIAPDNQGYSHNMSPNLRRGGGGGGGVGDILISVWIPSTLALCNTFLSAQYQCEPVLGFLPNFHGCIIGT